MKTAQIHRFRDLVAAYLGSGETVYLTPLDARHLAQGLIEAARDVERQPDFSASQFASREYDLTQTRQDRR